MPWENREKYDAAFAADCRPGQVTTPTIFLGGRDDWNVPVLNAELFYQSLRSAASTRSSSSTRIRTTAAGARSSRRTTCARVQAWFDKYLK